MIHLSLKEEKRRLDGDELGLGLRCALLGPPAEQEVKVNLLPLVTSEKANARRMMVEAVTTQLPPGTGAQVLCDRGYDADWWRERLLAAGHQPVVPGRRNRLIQPSYDEYVYRSRHLIENAFATLKSSRRIATRYEQTATAYRSWCTQV